MISKETIAKINDEADIVDVLSDFISMKKAGSNYKANCPFHQEKTPSFVISPSKQIYKCFGCGKAGDSVKFVMEHEHFSYVEALKYLAQKYNIKIEETEQSPEMIEQQSKREGLYIVNEFAKDFFKTNLFENETGKAIGLSYFTERGFTKDTIQKFDLGYALEQKDALTNAAIEKGYLLEMLQNAGLSSKKENLKLDFFRDRVMFPIHGISGKVLGFGGRILKSNVKTAKYINTPDTDIYDKSKVLYGIYFAKNEIRKQENCFLVEGYTDVISMHQMGIENVVASSGTSLTENQVKLIRRYSPNITVLYDGDNAGIKAALRGIDIILENGLNVQVVLLPENEDPDSFAQKNDKEDFLKFIAENQEDFIFFKTKLLLKDAENNPVKKAAVITDIIASISKIPDAIKRSLYIKETATLMQVSEQILINEANKTRKEIIKNRRKEQNKTDDIVEENVGLEENLAKKDEELLDAGINIEKYEREVIRTLLEYGDNRYSDDLMTYEYIFGKLESVPLENELHLKIIKLSKELNKEETKLSDYFINHQDEEISNLAITLIMGNLNKYDDALSEGWVKKKVFTTTKNEIYKEDINTELHWLNFFKIKLLERQILDKIKTASAEEMEKLLLIKQKVDIKKKELSSDKGTSYTPK
ncbi:MAG: DNA primase [Chitinophagales bacterium]|nr:DNA primase [Chitinophagales bacterium]